MPVNDLRLKVLDRATVEAIKAATERALRVVAAEFGATVEMGGGKYDPAIGLYSPAVTFTLDGGEERAFRQFCSFYRMTADDYGKEGTIRTTGGGSITGKLIGFDLKRPKYAVKVRKADGSISLFPERVLDVAFGRAPEPPREKWQGVIR